MRDTHDNSEPVDPDDLNHHRRNLILGLFAPSLGPPKLQSDLRAALQAEGPDQDIGVEWVVSRMMTRRRGSI
ncbi:hypothetical protein PGT21_025108 [Puccinia graminis f. sp. tritici]|uniref:Uncharacterized protein n=1 Tax=Puccinia graminis f. sp. tritici TaxID=56615 RepID=A0A5B0RGA1_PUCGR|nr:hypothetical protein PGT21_025108 [Puccinia graminis f. sp. tritici]KAA1123963.1 hypothetical protein PGTUg99_012999 [Puccinia graminis f. sp. tritici]